MRSLTKQLVVSLQSVPSSLKTIYDEVEKNSSTPQLSDFVDLFLEYSKQHSIVVLFDAFDECGEQEIVISQLVLRFYKSGIKVFITHRPFVLKNPESHFENVVTQEIRARREDIEAYVDHQLKNKEMAKGCLDSQFKNGIVKQISDLADGVYESRLCVSEFRFLLASFQAQHVLREDGQINMEKALQSLPTSQIEVYENAFFRITNSKTHTSKLAITTLTWICYAKRPLQKDELHEAICIEERVSYNKSAFIASIVDSCQSLVVYEESTGVVRFFHPTVQEFLNSKKLPSSNLAKACLTYLDRAAFSNICHDEESMRNRYSQYKFCLYAAQYWGFHTRGEAETCSSIQEVFFRLFTNEGTRNSILQMAYYSNFESLRFAEGQTILHVIARNGLFTMYELFIYKQK